MSVTATSDARKTEPRRSLSMTAGRLERIGFSEGNANDSCENSPLPERQLLNTEIAFLFLASPASRRTNFTLVTSTRRSTSTASPANNPPGAYRLNLARQTRRKSSRPERFIRGCRRHPGNSFCWCSITHSSALVIVMGGMRSKECLPRIVGCAWHEEYYELASRSQWAKGSKTVNFTIDDGTC